MATRTISTKVAVSGEDAYKASLKNINSSLGTLKSELKLVESSFSGQANSYAALSAKGKTLASMYEAQQNKVNSLKEALSNAERAQSTYAERVDKARGNIARCEAALEALSNETGDTSEQQAKLTAELEGYQKELDEAQSYQQAATRSVNAWQTQLNNAQTDLNKLGTEIDKNNTYLGEAESSSDQCARSIDEYGKEVKQAGTSTENLTDSVEDYGDEATEAARDTESFGNKLKNGLAAGAKIAAAAVATAVASITAIAAAMGAAMAATVREINDCIEVHSLFEDSMLQVAATMGITQKEIANGSESYEKLTAAAKEAGSTTRYSASEAAQALNYLALAGYDADAAVETLPKVLNLASAGGMELATTSDLVTDAMSALQMETGELDGFIDMLAKTSQKSNTSVQQLGDAMLVAAGTATTTGQKLNTLSTSLGVLADNGIKGSEGGTHLRNVLLSLSAPTDKAAGQLSELGISVYDAQGNMRQLDEILGDLNSSLSVLSQDERTNALSNIFNKADLGAVNALLSSTTGRFEELSGILEDCSGAASEMAGTMEAGLAGTTRSFQSAMEGMQIEAGSIFAGLKQTIISDATEIINSFTTNLAAAGGDWDLIGEAIGQALSDAVLLIGEYLPHITETGMAILSTLGNALTDNSEVLLETATSIITTLLEGAISALPTLTPVALDILAELTAAIVSLLPQLADAGVQIIVTLIEGIAKELPTLIPAAVKTITQLVQGLIDNIPMLIDAALALIEGLAEGVIQAIPVLLEALPELIQSLLDALLAAVPQLIDAALALIEGLAEGILQAIPVLLEALPELIESILDTLLAAIPQIIEAGVTLLTALVDNLPTIIDTIVKVLPKIINSVISTLLDHLPDIIKAGVQLFTALITNLPQIIVTLIGAVPEIVGSIVSTLVDNIPKIVQTGVQLLGSLIKDLPKAISQITSSMPQIITGMVNALSKGVTQFTQIGANLVRGLWSGIQSLAGWLWDNVSGWMQNIWNGVLDFFGIHSPSKRFEWVSEKNLEGSVVGVDKNKHKTVKAYGDMTKEMLSEVETGMDKVNAALAGSIGDIETGINARATIAQVSAAAPAVYDERRGGIVRQNSETNVTNNFHIAALHVREEADVKKVARELYDMQRFDSRGRGVV